MNSYVVVSHGATGNHQTQPEEGSLHYVVADKESYQALGHSLCTL